MTPTQHTPRKRRPLLKLRGKFILAISIILVIIFGLTAFFLLRSTRDNLTKDLNRETQAFAALATKPIGDTYTVYSQSGTILIKQQMQKFANLDSNVTNIAVVNLEGLSQFSLTGSPVSVSTQAVTSFDPTTQSNAHGQIILVVRPYISDAGQHSYAVAYQISPARVEQSITHQELIIWALTLLGLLVSAAAAYEFINYFFLNPINKLNRMAQIVAAGDYGTSIASNRKDEIGTLTGSINYMASVLKSDIAKLQELDKRKNEFIVIASHNLRTPLTIIQGNVSMLEQAKLDDRLRKMVQAVEESARNLNVFSEEMLTIASLEFPGDKRPVFSKIVLGELLQPLVEEFTKMAVEKPIIFKPQIHDAETTFYGDRFQLISAVRNLLDNAFKFSSQDDEVDLIASFKDDKILINVRDQGIGIKDEEIPKLFTKFHRGTETMTYDYKGTGIGLYAVKLIVERHGGNVSVQSKLGQGSSFTIELPPNDPAQAASIP